MDFFEAVKNFFAKGYDDGGSGDEGSPSKDAKQSGTEENPYSVPDDNIKENARAWQQKQREDSLSGLNLPKTLASSLAGSSAATDYLTGSNQDWATSTSNLNNWITAKQKEPQDIGSHEYVLRSAPVKNADGTYTVEQGKTLKQAEREEELADRANTYRTAMQQIGAQDENEKRKDARKAAQTAWGTWSDEQERLENEAANYNYGSAEDVERALAARDAHQKTKPEFGNLDNVVPGDVKLSQAQELSLLIDRAIQYGATDDDIMKMLASLPVNEDAAATSGEGGVTEDDMIKAAAASDVDAAANDPTGDSAKQLQSALYESWSGRGDKRYYTEVANRLYDNYAAAYTEYNGTEPPYGDLGQFLGRCTFDEFWDWAMFAHDTTGMYSKYEGQDGMLSEDAVYGFYEYCKSTYTLSTLQGENQDKISEMVDALGVDPQVAQYVVNQINSMYEGSNLDYKNWMAQALLHNQGHSNDYWNDVLGQVYNLKDSAGDDVLPDLVGSYQPGTKYSARNMTVDNTSELGRGFWNAYESGTLQDYVDSGNFANMYNSLTPDQQLALAAIMDDKGFSEDFAKAVGK